jgi:hypothetical protein
MHRDHRKIPRRAAPGLDGPGRARIHRHAGSAQRGWLHALARLAATTSRSGCERARIEPCRRAGASRSHRPPIGREDRRPVRGARAVAATGVCARSNAARCRRSDISRSFDSSGSPRAPTAGGGKGRKRSTVGNALDTAVPNDPASFAPYLLAREPFARGHTPRLGGIPFENRAGYKRMIIQCHRALILGRGAKECHSVMVPGGDAPFLDIMTVQDLRLEIRRDAPQQPRFPRS